MWISTAIITFYMYQLVGVSEIVFQAVLLIGLIKPVEHFISTLIEKKAFPTLKELYPTKEKLKILFKILIGVIFGLILFRLEPIFSNKLSDFLKKVFNINLTEEQNVAHLLKDKSLFGILMSLYASIGAPILEETIFRGFLHNYFNVTAMDSKDKVATKKNVTSRLEKIKTIVKTSLIFGAVLLSPSMGWTNIPIMLFITLIGATLSILNPNFLDF